MSVKLRASGWELAGTHLPWIWGQINYWDLDRSRWRDVLRAYFERGNAVVSVAVLPRVHQTAAGVYDFTLQPQLDLAAYLHEAGQIGLKVVLWLGPRDTPGAAAAGYPETLLRDESALALDAEGRWLVSSPGQGGDVFSLPSLVAEPLARELGAFSAEVGKIIPPFMHPDGPVIGLGLTLAPGWRPALSAFAADYHPDALRRYRDFLKKRHRRLAALNEAYGESYAALDAIEPPRALPTPADALTPRFQDWAAFREEYFVAAAESLHAVFAPLAQDRVPVFLAGLPGSGLPSNPNELGRSRCFDYHMPDAPSDFHTAAAEHDYWLRAAGQNRFLGWFQARPELDLDSSEASDREYRLQRQIAQGLRAWDAFAPSGSGGYPGFLTDRMGSSLHAQAAFWETLREQGRSEGFLQSQFYADVLLLTVPEFERARYLQTPPEPRFDLVGILQPPPAPEPALDPATAGYRDRVAALEGLLTAGQYAFSLVSSDAASDRVGEGTTLLVPGAETLPAALQAQVTEWLDKGATVIVAGPLPAYPEGAAHPPLSELAGVKPKTVKTSGGKPKGPKPGRLHHLPELDEAKFTRLLQVSGVPREIVIDDPRLRLTYHRFRNRIFVAVDNPATDPVEATVSREGKFVLKDFGNSKRFLGGNQEIRITLPPRSVKFWELIPC